jgi:ABC-2 type transport system permease protein
MNLKKLRAYLRVVVCTAQMTFLQNVFDSFIIFTVLVQPLVIAILALWMLEARGGDYAVFVVVGSGMTGLWSSLLYISGNSINWERWTGTLEMLVGQPTPIYWVIFGKNLAQVLQSLGSMIVAYVTASLIFGYPLTLAQPLAFFISLVFTVLAFVCFGLIVAPIFVLNPAVQRWQNGLEFPIYILSGFLFPIALLPGWTTPLSYILAPYWAARALHGASTGGAGLSEIAFSLFMLTVFSLTYIALSRKLFQVLLVRARRDATLGMQ